MRKTMTRTELKQIDDEINALPQSAPTLFLLLENRIRLFKEKFDRELKINKARFFDILDKYVQKDPASGEFLTEEIDGKKKWMFIRSLPDLINARVLDVSQVETKFNEECKAFFEQTITVDW